MYDYAISEAYNTDSEEIILNAIDLLQSLSSCDKIVVSLTKQLEKRFQKIKENKGKKKLGKITYYSNGLIKSQQGKSIIASPWESTIPIVLKEQKKKMPSYNFNELNEISRFYIAQLKQYRKTRLPETYVDLAPALKQLEMYCLLPENDRKILKIDLRDIVNLATQLKNYFSNMTYLTQEQCEKIYQIYIATESEPGAYRGYRFYHEVREKIKEYLNTITLNTIPYQISTYSYSTNYYQLCSEIQTSRDSIELCNMHLKSIKDITPATEKEIRDEIQKHEQRIPKLEKQLHQNLIDATSELRSFYRAAYSIEDKEFHRLLIRLNVIEEGYEPKEETFALL